MNSIKNIFSSSKSTSEVLIDSSSLIKKNDQKEDKFSKIDHSHDPRPYNSLQNKNNIAQMDKDIHRLASQHLDHLENELKERETILDYDELKRVAWAAELANDFDTMHHIANLMMRRDQESKIVTSLNSAPGFLLGKEEKRLFSSAYDSKVKRLQSAIDYTKAVSEKRSYNKLKESVTDYLKKLIQELGQHCATYINYYNQLLEDIELKEESRIFIEKLKCDAKRHIFEHYSWIVKNTKTKSDHNNHITLMEHSSLDAMTHEQVLKEYNLHMICANYDEAVAKFALKEQYEKLYEEVNNDELGIYNIVKLSVINNYAVFLFEILGEKVKGKEILEQSYKDYQIWEADMNRQPTLDDVQKAKDSKDMIGLIYENSKVWETIIAQEEEEKEEKYKSTIGNN